MHPRARVEKEAEALKSIENSSAALAEKLGIEIQPLPDVRRYDPDLGRTLQLEHLAEVFAQIAEATGTEKAAVKTKPKAKK